MGTFEYEVPGLKDYHSLAELLGIRPESIDSGSDVEVSGAGPVTLSQMFDEANRELLTASEMQDTKRQRIVAKTLRWLQFLEQRSQTLTENARAFVDRWIRDMGASEFVSKREGLEQVVARLEWSLVAITRWIERRLPLSRRRESGARLEIRWQVAGAEGRWDGVDDVIPMREVCRECLLIDGRFPAEQAGPLADRLLQEVRLGRLWLPRLTRGVDSTSEQTVLCYESLGSRAQPATSSLVDEQIHLDAIKDFGTWERHDALHLDLAADSDLSLDLSETMPATAAAVPGYKWDDDLLLVEKMPELAEAEEKAFAEPYASLDGITFAGGMLQINGVLPADSDPKHIGPIRMYKDEKGKTIGYSLSEGGLRNVVGLSSQQAVLDLATRLGIKYRCSPREVVRRLQPIAYSKLQTAQARRDYTAIQQCQQACAALQQFMVK